ncbi:hypothetical protein ZIOFF_070832 [Zingiber officinale]|uniref:Pentatricopeptide repeat-containing protein n=1 Tax=Zingiber officinale TaxID=94328 RepID=A0A8J5C7M8_ZINOF|nr:hypothetical protein ZIOFF_070832 [Zingiber officinale]
MLAKKSISSGSLEISLEMSGLMMEFGHLPTWANANNMIVNLIRNGRIHQASEHEKEGSFGPNVYSYTVLVLGLRKEELWEEAYRVLKLMEDEGCMPTVVAYTILIRNLCKKKGSLRRHLSGKGPDSVSFNTILSMACKQCNSSMISRIFIRMDIEGTKLDTVGMICLMQYFSKANRPLECYNIFKFKNAGIFPDITSYNILLHASIKEGDYFLMKCLLFNMYRQGLLPDGITYGSLSHGLCKEGNISSAVRLEDWMLELNIKPTMPYYNTILDAVFRIHIKLFNNAKDLHTLSYSLA